MLISVCDDNIDRNVVIGNMGIYKTTVFKLY